MILGGTTTTVYETKHLLFDHSFNNMCCSIQKGRLVPSGAAYSAFYLLAEYLGFKFNSGSLLRFRFNSGKQSNR